MTITFKDSFFSAHSIIDENDKLKRAGFKWDIDKKKWMSTDFRCAETLISYCDSLAVFQIRYVRENLQKAVQKSASAEGSGTIPLYHQPNMIPYPYQQAGVEYMLPRPAVILADQMGLGKMESVDNRLFTPYGRKRIGDVKPGDEVIGSDGNHYKITDVFPQGEKDLYRVTFNDGCSVLVGLEHLWTVFTREVNTSRKVGRRDRTIVLTTSQLLNKNLKLKIKGIGWNEKRPYEFSTYYIEKNGNLKWQIPVVKPIEFKNNDILPIDPYLLGLILGDGHIAKGGAKFTIHKDDFDEIFQYYNITQTKNNPLRPNVRFCYIDGTVKEELHLLGLKNKRSDTKFIPDIYKYASIEDRISILQGLMDTDGHCMLSSKKRTKKDTFSGTEYCSVSEQLADDVCEIVNSLGGIARKKSKIGSYKKDGVKHICKKAYRINIKMPEGINPFRLKRKADRYNPPQKYKVARYIKNIEFEKVGEAVCISVDSPDNLYVTEHAIVTHNTAQALITVNMRHPVEAIIVCPSILKYNWLKEARKWMIGHITVYVYESTKIRYYKARMTKHDKNTTLHIINYDILVKFKDRLMQIPFNFFIADECHKMKNQDAIRTKISVELAKKAKWKIFITGTPIYNKPKDLFVTLNLIDPNMFGDKFQFEQRYCGAYKSKGVTKYAGATNADELNTILRANYMVRRLAKDVMKDLPEKVKDVIVLSEGDLNTIVQKEKKAVEESRVEEEKLTTEIDNLRELAKTNEQYEAEYKERVKKLREIRFKNFGELSRIRKELAIKKTPYVVNFVKEILDNSEDQMSKIVVFGHHTEVLEKLFAELKKYKPVMIIGKTSDSQRQQSINLFSQKNDTRVFIGSMGAAGTGVDGLQNNCNIAVFAELDWTPSLVDQAESRLQRIGQKDTVWVYHIVADESLDSKIIKMMMEKEAVAKDILDYRPEQMYTLLINDENK